MTLQNRARFTKIGNNKGPSKKKSKEAKKQQKPAFVEVPMDVQRLHHLLIEKDLKIKERDLEIYSLREVQRRHEKALLEKEKESGFGSRFTKLQAELKSLQLKSKNISTKYHNSESHIARLQDDLFKLHQENLRLSVDLRQLQQAKGGSGSFVFNHGSDQGSINNRKISQPKSQSDTESLRRKDQHLLELEEKLIALEQSNSILLKQRDRSIDDQTTSNSIWERKEESWHQREYDLLNIIQDLKKTVAALEYQRGRSKSFKMFDAASRSSSRSRDPSPAGKGKRPESKTLDFKIAGKTIPKIEEEAETESAKKENHSIQPSAEPVNKDVQSEKESSNSVEAPIVAPIPLKQTLDKGPVEPIVQEVKPPKSTTPIKSFLFGMKASKTPEPVTKSPVPQATSVDSPKKAPEARRASMAVTPKPIDPKTVKTPDPATKAPDPKLAKTGDGKKASEAASKTPEHHAKITNPAASKTPEPHAKITNPAASKTPETHAKITNPAASKTPEPHPKITNPSHLTHDTTSRKLFPWEKVSDKKPLTNNSNPTVPPQPVTSSNGGALSKPNWLK